MPCRPAGGNCAEGDLKTAHLKTPSAQPLLHGWLQSAVWPIAGVTRSSQNQAQRIKKLPASACTCSAKYGAVSTIAKRRTSAQYNSPELQCALVRRNTKKNVVWWEHGDGWAKSSKAVSMEKSLGLGLEAPVRDVATPRWCFELRYACGSQCHTGRVLRTRPPTRPRRNRNLEYAQVPFNAQPVPLGTW